MMHQKTTIYRASLLLLLFWSTLLVASIQVDDFKLYYDTAKQSKTQMPSTYSVTSDTIKVWLSAKIKDAPPKTKVSIIWYYIKDNRLEKLYEKTTLGEGSATIMSDLKWKDQDTFVSGRYRVDFFLNDRVQKTLYFSVLAPKATLKAPTKECIKPTKVDNKILIEDTLQNYPSMRDKIETLNLKRYHGRGHRFSTILPKAWEITKDPSTNVLLTLSNKTKQNKKSRYIVREISVDELKRLTKANSTVVQTAVKLLADASLEVNEKSKLTIPPKIVNLSDITVGRLEAIHTKNTKKFWERHTIIYDGKYLYDFVLFTDNKNPEYRGFLSALCVYAFWTQESCK